MQKNHPREELVGTRLVLRKHDPGLAAPMYDHVDHDRARLRLFLPWVDLTRSVKDEIDYIEMTSEAWNNHAVFDYGLFRKPDGAYMGNCGVHTIHWQERRCEIGYWILGVFEGQGYVSEAVRVLESELFRLGFDRIEIRCDAKNARSAAVPRRNGYHLDKVVRKEGEGQRDTLVFAKTRELPFEEAADFLIGSSAEHVVYFTGDMGAARDFVSRAFDLRPVLNQPEICEFKIGAQSLILQPADQDSPPGTATEMSYWPVGDLEAAVQRCLAAGGIVVRGPIDVDADERICQVQDPAGNIFGLRGRP